MAYQQQLTEYEIKGLTDSMVSRINSLTYNATDEVHTGTGYELYEFSIDRLVADIGRLPANVRTTYEIDFYTRMLTQNPHVQELCKANGLNPASMPRWNELSPHPQHAGLGNLKDYVRQRSVRSTQTLDKELNKPKGTQTWSQFANHWIDAYKERHGGPPRAQDLVTKLLSAVATKHHSAMTAACTTMLSNPASSFNSYILYFRTFDEMLGSPSDTPPQPANPNAMQIDQVQTPVMQVIAFEAQQWAARGEAAARGDHAMVAAINAGMTCFTCHQPGHFARECPKKKEEEDKARRGAQKEKEKALAKLAAKFQKGKGQGSQ